MNPSRVSASSRLGVDSRIFLCVLSLFLCALRVSAGDEWSEPFAGVRHLHRTTDNPKWDMHLAFVDLTEKGVAVTATPPGERRAAPSAFARRKNAAVAVNADFFSYKNYATMGPAMGEGKIWTDSGADVNFRGQVVAAGNRVEIIPPEVIYKPEPWARDIVSGAQLFVHEGKFRDDWAERHPRTAAGLTKDRKTLILFVVDGRQKHSVGMTCREMSTVFIEFGAWSAINLDGGGSSEMVLDGRVVNRPSDGRERVSANQLGVLAVKGASRPKGGVRGIVREKGTGKPLPGAKVALTAAYSDATHADGFFHLSQVPAGPATLTITLAGYGTVKTPVKALPNRTADVTVELAPSTPPVARASAAAPSGPGLASAPPAPAAGGDADRLLSRARTYQKGKMWGKTLGMYQDVVKQYPGTAQAAEAQSEMAKIESLLAGSGDR